MQVRLAWPSSDHPLLVLAPMWPTESDKATQFRGGVVGRDVHWSPARLLSWRAIFEPVVRSSTITRIVSSPATVPSTPGTPARSMADPTTWAEPGGVRNTTRL